VAVWSEVRFVTLEGAGRVDAEYYQPIYIRERAFLRALPNVRLGNVAFVTDGQHGYHKVDPDSDIKHITAKCVVDNLVVADGADHLAAETHLNNLRSILEADDIILSTAGTIGNCGIVTDDVLPANIDQDVARIHIYDQAELSPWYVSTFLNCELGRLQTTFETTGQVQKHLSLGAVRNLLIPRLSDEKAIADTAAMAWRQRKESTRLYTEAESLLLHALGLDTLDTAHELTYERNFHEVAAAGRFDAQYYHPEKAHVLEQLAKLPGHTIGEHFLSINDLLVPPAKDTGEVVQNYDLDEALRFFLDEIEPLPTCELGSTKKRFQHGDVVVSRLRSYLKEIALVESPPSANCIGSTEFIVLRGFRTDVSPELLTVYLRSSPVQKILKWCQDGSQHPRFKEEELRAIKLPDCLLDAQDDIKRLVRAAIDAHRDAKRLLDAAKRRVEAMILGSEG